MGVRLLWHTRRSHSERAVANRYRPLLHAPVDHRVGCLLAPGENRSACRAESGRRDQGSHGGRRFPEKELGIFCAPGVLLLGRERPGVRDRMTTANLNVFVRRLARSMKAEALGEQSDQQLVERFLAARDEAAFEALL